MKILYFSSVKCDNLPLAGIVREAIKGGLFLNRFMEISSLCLPKPEHNLPYPPGQGSPVVLSKAGRDYLSVTPY
jgi:hypothetical protein